MKEIAAGDRKRRDTSDAINGITLYANSKTRFIRKAVPKNVGSTNRTSVALLFL